jgi:hypothetical protein
MGAHATIQPSSIKRTILCPASVKEGAEVVRPDTEDSAQGTARHWVAAQWLTDGDPPAAGAKTPEGMTVTEEMIEDCRAGVEWVRQYMLEAEKRGNVYVRVEERVQVGQFLGLDPDLFWGTADVLLFATNEMVVLDHKFGYVSVPVEDNEQLKAYAFGAAAESGWLWDRIRLVINQPKDGGIKEWVISMDALIEWAEGKLKSAVTAAMGESPPFNPTEEGCRFCNAAGVCRALQQHAIEIAQKEFDVVAIERLGVGELSMLLAKADLIDAALKAVREHATKLLSLGTKVPGWKLVEGRKNRVWKPNVEKTIITNAELFGLDPDKVAPRKLISPAQMEKMSEALVEQFAEKPRGAPVLAPESDKRPALADDFQVMDAGHLLD